MIAVLKNRLRAPLAVAAGFALGVAVAAAIGTAHSTERPSATDVSGRYAMQPTEGGMLRLDTATGAITFCKAKGATWGCEAIADERQVLEDELKRPQGREQLAEGVGQTTRRDCRASSGQGSRKAGRDASRWRGLQVADRRRVDKAMTYVERMLKKFKDKLKDLEAETGKKGTNL